MTDPFKVLAELEERVKKAEATIPEFQKQMKETSLAYAQAMDRNEQLAGKLKKYEELTAMVKDAFGLNTPFNPSASTGTTGTVEIHDSAAILGVKDPQEKLVADTKTVIGQIGQCILDGYIVPKRMRVGEVEDLLANHFNAEWGKGQVQMGLETLTAPPYRLFVHTVDAQKRHFFQLRETVKDRVVKD